MKKNVRYSVDDIVIDAKDDNMPKYIDVYNNDGILVTSIQLYFNCYENEYGQVLEDCPEDCSCNEEEK